MITGQMDTLLPRLWPKSVISVLLQFGEDIDDDEPKAHTPFYRKFKFYRNTFLFTTRYITSHHIRGEAYLRLSLMHRSRQLYQVCRWDIYKGRLLFALKQFLGTAKLRGGGMLVRSFALVVAGILLKVLNKEQLPTGKDAPPANNWQRFKASPARCVCCACEYILKPSFNLEARYMLTVNCSGL
jgi:hypothetical protein